jgi:hypothetical protein
MTIEYLLLTVQLVGLNYVQWCDASTTKASFESIKYEAVQNY